MSVLETKNAEQHYPNPIRLIHQELWWKNTPQSDQTCFTEMERAEIDMHTTDSLCLRISVQSQDYADITEGGQGDLNFKFPKQTWN